MGIKSSYLLWIILAIIPCMVAFLVFSRLKSKGINEGIAGAFSSLLLAFMWIGAVIFIRW